MANHKLLAHILKHNPGSFLKRNIQEDLYLGRGINILHFRVFVWRVWGFFCTFSEKNQILP